ncbi:MAG: ParB/RepB/Spo0J family partition protein [Candidatus Dormibacteria bacterium]
MSKKKGGSFRDKIDSILAEGAGAESNAPEQELESLRRRVDGVLATPVAEKRPDDALARMLAPTTETKLDEIDMAKIKLRDGRKLRSTDPEVARVRESIKERGIMQPILLRAAGDGYEVVDGERRFVAARALKLKAVPAIVKKVTDAEVRATVAEREAERARIGPAAPATAARKPAGRPRKAATATTASVLAATEAATVASSGVSSDVPWYARGSAEETATTAKPTPAGRGKVARKPKSVVAAAVPNPLPTFGEPEAKTVAPPVAVSRPELPAREDSTRVSPVAASPRQARADGLNTNALLLPLAVALASFVVSTATVFHDSATAMQALVVAAILLALVLFARVWRHA